VKKVCLQCGKEFLPKDERQNRPAKYCSRACSHKAQKTKVTLVCRQCGREFQRKAYMKEWSKERGPFCNFECYGQWQKSHSLGEKNPNYV